ncbi:hypothetical protein [Listeria booriae]|uniref:hypothetical protein n=1 Tax=Listeria booriae TaxID=1552123 RepID=UPI001627437C|nr:hypothetical protein [Listeria booriae]MBC2196306.1 hypothetical protein [Listeria booriae]
MWIDFENFRALLKQTGFKVYRDKAPVNTPYPYIVYTHAFEKDKRASNKRLGNIKTFQVSIFTTETEKEINKLTNILDASLVPYASFDSIQGDENDDTVTNYFTYVDVMYDVK